MSTNTKAVEMLEQVNSAISAVLAGGQSYKIGSRSLTRADLAMLRGASHGTVGGAGSPLGLEWAGEIAELAQLFTIAPPPPPPAV